MFKLNSDVEIVKTGGTGKTGRVIIRSHYLAGYSLYEVEFLAPKALEGDVAYIIKCHENEIKLISEDDATDDPEPDPDLSLGARVLIRVADIDGIITNHTYSNSGCVEYEVTYHEPGVGIKRQLFEAEILEPIKEAEKIPVGSQTGSLVRESSTR